MTVQLAITLVIVAAAVGYAARRVYTALKRAGNPCYGCPGCQLRNQLKGKHITARKPHNPTCPHPGRKKKFEKKTTKSLAATNKCATFATANEKQ